MSQHNKHCIVHPKEDNWVDQYLKGGVIPSYATSNTTNVQYHNFADYAKIIEDLYTMGAKYGLKKK